MGIRNRLSVHGGAANHSKHYFSLPIDTQAKPGIYSPHLEFRPSVPFASTVANNSRGARDVQSEESFRSGSCKRVEVRLSVAGRSQALGKNDVTVVPNQPGRSETDLCPARESGSPLLRSMRSSPPQPDLPGFELEHQLNDEEPCDFSDSPGFLALRHGLDFTAIRRGQ